MVNQVIIVALRDHVLESEKFSSVLGFIFWVFPQRVRTASGSVCRLYEIERVDGFHLGTLFNMFRFCLIEIGAARFPAGWALG